MSAKSYHAMTWAAEARSHHSKPETHRQRYLRFRAQIEGIKLARQRRNERIANLYRQGGE